MDQQGICRLAGIVSKLLLLRTQWSRSGRSKYLAPGLHGVGLEDAGYVERVGFDQLLGVVRRGDLVDDEGAGVVLEGAGHGELALLLEAAEVLAVARSDFGD